MVAIHTQFKEKMKMGQYYKSAKEFTDIFTSLFKKILQDPDMSGTLKSLNKVFAFKFTDPDVSITINPSKTEDSITIGGSGQEGEIKMWMTTDAAHKLLLGKLNPMAAIMSRQIRVTGPFQAMSNVVKVFSATSQIYREVLTENDLDELLK